MDRIAPVKHRKIELFQVVLSLVFFIMALVFLYPMFYVLMASFSHPAAVSSAPYLIIPVNPTLEIYRILFRYKALWQGYFNSLIYLTAGTSLSVVCTMMGAYAITRPNLWGKKVLLFFIILTMFISGGMIPTFLVVKELGLLNKRLAMILPSAISTWNLFIARSYIKVNIPDELHDSAEIDGAGEFRYFTGIVLPLSKAILAVLALFYGSSIWNSYFSALIYLRNRALYPLQLILREILIQNDVLMEMGDQFADDILIKLGLKYAATIAAVLPLMALFPFVQRYFVKGVMIGSLKG